MFTIFPKRRETSQLNGYTTIGKICKQITDIDFVFTTVNKLRKRAKTNNQQDTPLVHGRCGDTPLAHGRWAKPACLDEAKFDFLVVDATVISTRDRQKFHTIGKTDTKNISGR